MDRPLVDVLRVMEQKKHSNQDEIDRLEEENRQLLALYVVTMGTLGASAFFPVAFLLAQFFSYAAGAAGTRWVLTRAQKVYSLLKNTKALVEAFPEEEIEIFTDLPVPDHGSLDMLVKLRTATKKAVFAIALRTQGKSTITYNEEKEVFYIRRRGGTNRWTPDHVERLGVQGFWLRMNRQEELFGTSRNDRNRPIVKLLVITGETQIGQHPDHLYTEIGDQRVLLLQRRSTVFVLREEQLLPFLKVWLTTPPNK
ncbi:hypothetical protein NDI45_25185 [Leptolyngbya sp. GB1-A1]|uniref:hypothetical protein n=1 Tax=Leptolyngbya sp. GB1-A1 TaxID=2933908 RepID=UPI0032969443